MSLVTWIWQTLHRLHLSPTKTPAPTLADSLGRLAPIYSPTPAAATSTNRALNSHLSGLLHQLALAAPLEPKCPLEKYLNLVLHGGDLASAVERSVDTIHLILAAHKKHPRLQEISYSLVFQWFESLIFKYSTVRLKRRLGRGASLAADAVPLIGVFREVCNRLLEFRIYNMARFFYYESYKGLVVK